MTDIATLLEVGGPVAALGGGAAYARAKHPAVYWSTVGLPVSSARLLGSYASVMEACGLTVAPSRLRVLAVKATTNREIRPVPPRRGIIRPTTTGLRVRLRLAPGQEPADVAASAERLRHAWGVHAVYVTTVKPGVVELRLVGYDVLRRVRMPRKVDSGHLRIPVALREDATPFARDYRTIPHQLTLVDVDDADGHERPTAHGVLGDLTGLPVAHLRRRRFGEQDRGGRGVNADHTHRIFSF